MKLINSIREEAKLRRKTIIFPESHDKRIVEAASVLQKNKIASTILLGAKEAITEIANGIGINLNGIQIINPLDSEHLEDFAESYYQKRKHKGVTIEIARRIIIHNTFFAAMCVEKGLADGCVSGADTTTGEVMRAALHIIGTASGIRTVSSDILMVLPETGQVLSFADCAVLPAPTMEQLADIAIATAETHRKIVKEEPKIAMLSFSTKGSAQHENVEKVIQATQLVKQKRPDLLIDGELQFDAAYVPAVGKRKAPDSPVAGQANVFIFPNLEAGNIGYKMVQRIGHSEAIGPIIQGLAKPMNDLSRGCSVDDIVNVAAILCNLC